MPEMSRVAKGFCTSGPYRAFARRVLVPWGLQGVRLAGEALEIGSGSGAMAAELLASYRELRLVATDYDPDMLRAAQQTLAGYGQRASVQRADATNLPFVDGRFDAVLSFAMLHHVGDWERALAEATRVLRLGGWLIGYDLLDVMPFRLFHGAEPDKSQMLRPGQLERALARLPVSGVRTRRGAAGLVLRFSAWKCS